jgi:carboxypeptidase PM20D1
MTLFLIITAILAGLLAVIVWRTASFKSKGHFSAKYDAGVVDADKAAENLSGAIRIKTVSNEDYTKVDFSQFDLFQKYLAEKYPRVYTELSCETVNTYSLLYHWKSASPEKKPVLLMAHYDVVPVEDGSEALWTHPPFSGEITDGMIWGRGTLDIKCQVIGILESVEALLAEGFIPGRDLYITFGHDEEVDGQQGALLTAALLEKRGLSFEFILDEGSFIAENIIPGVIKPLALIGTCEKGYSDVKLSCTSNGGHSSTPLGSTALSTVCEGVSRLQRNQFRKRITLPVKWFLKTVGPEMPLIDRIALSNLWLFDRLFMKRLSRLPSGNALLRTTTAATMAGGSPQANVLPQKAWAVLNFRLLSGETCEDLARHIKKVLRGLDIKMEFLISNNPSAVSSCESDAFKTVEKTVMQVFPDALPTPYIMTGASDSIKYEKVSPNIFRFSPYRMKPGDMSRIHGNNECIPVESMAGVVRFYKQLIKNL